MPRKLDKILGDINSSLNNLQTETDIGNKTTELIMTKTRSVNVNERHLIVQQKFTGSGFILGHPVNGILGTGMMLPHTGSFITIRVLNQDRIYIDKAYSITFKDTSSTTATWTTTGQIVFGTNQVAQSLPIYLNNETISSATPYFNLVTDGSSNVYLYLSANGGGVWDEVTNESAHSFSSVGTDLRWKISGSNFTCSTNLTSSTSTIPAIKIIY